MTANHHTDLMLVLGRYPMEPMAVAILELRKAGYHGLADELTRQRDEWARTVAKAAQERAGGKR